MFKFALSPYSACVTEEMFLSLLKISKGILTHKWIQGFWGDKPVCRYAWVWGEQDSVGNLRQMDFL